MCNRKHFIHTLPGLCRENHCITQDFSWLFSQTYAVKTQRNSLLQYASVPSYTVLTLCFPILVIDPFAFHVHWVLILPSLLSLFPEQEARTMLGRLQLSTTGAGKGQTPAPSRAQPEHAPRAPPEGTKRQHRTRLARTEALPTSGAAFPSSPPHPGTPSRGGGLPQTQSRPSREPPV